MPHRPEHPGPVGTGEGGAVFRPLIFGEALFDHFPDGSRVLGGAPFNVAWHLQGFKARPLMVTAVGKDPDGAEILERMAGWGMDTHGVGIHPVRPTGRVTARFSGGEPHYEIEARQAYDAIAMDHLPPPPELRRVRLLYHGSLAVREETSARTLTFLRTALGVPTLMDVNLRDPWWSRDTLLGQMKGTEWVKMNREELGLLARLPVQSSHGLEAAASTLREDLGIGTLVVTTGAQGAMAATVGEVHWQEAPSLEETVDPVGAGDAFSAVLALGIHRGWPLGTTLRRAAEFAAELCRVRGATSEDPDLYSHYLGRWSDAA